MHHCVDRLHLLKKYGNYFQIWYSLWKGFGILIYVNNKGFMLLGNTTVRMAKASKILNCSVKNI